MSIVPVRRALISVSDKRGVVALAQGLAARGVEILSTGGTKAALVEANVPVISVSDHTGAPEILDGRVKTLHPKIHGGLLARGTAAHMAELLEHQIAAIDLVIVNLYPFTQTIARSNASYEAAIENIDIGGPTMLRAAAKNHERVTVVVNPDDYQELLAALTTQGGVAGPVRKAYAQKAFAHTAAYDAAIAGYLSAVPDEAAVTPSAAPSRAALPAIVGLQLERAYELRYGENPHQIAAFYRNRDATGLVTQVAGRPTLATAEVLGGKALSYNNLLDLDAALGLALEFTEPTAVVVKHNNPCGVASAETVASAYVRARQADPVSAFGGIVACNRVVDAATATLLCETFLECVIAPGYEPAARELLATKKNLRVVVGHGTWQIDSNATAYTVRTIAGGALVQTIDAGMVDLAQAKVVTQRTPEPAMLRDLQFAWRVAKHVKSNAIVFARDSVTLAIGAGQMSRVDSVAICERKAGASLSGAVVASDAFFPFRDGVDILANVGAVAVVQPGGSVRDSEVIAAADEHGLAMVFTGMRHFRH